MYRKNAEARRFFHAIAAPMPQNYQVVGYLVVIATVELLIDHSKRGEITEFAGVIIFALNVITLRTKASSKLARQVSRCDKLINAKQ